MKFQKSTLVLMLIALISGGVIYVYEVEGKPQREAAKARENRIFPFEEKDVRSVTLKTKDYKLQFSRTDQKTGSNPSGSKWLLKVLEKYQTEPPKDTAETQSPELTLAELLENEELKSLDPKANKSPKNRRNKSPSPKPIESPKANDTITESPSAKPTEKVQETLPYQTTANEAYVVYLLNLLATGKGDRISADPRMEDGLNQPLATIDIKLNNGKTHQMVLGIPNYNNSALYALADPPQQLNKPLQVLLVSTDFQNAVNRPLSEWKLEADKKDSDKPAVEDTNGRYNVEPDNASDKPAAEESNKKEYHKSDKVESDKGADRSPSPDSKKNR